MDGGGARGAGASDAIASLLGLQPKSARVMRDGAEVMLPVESVLPDDIVAVRPGERLPVDGIVTEGGVHNRRIDADGGEHPRR